MTTVEEPSLDLIFGHLGFTSVSYFKNVLWRVMCVHDETSSLRDVFQAITGKYVNWIGDLIRSSHLEQITQTLTTILEYSNGTRKQNIFRKKGDLITFYLLYYWRYWVWNISMKTALTRLISINVWYTLLVFCMLYMVTNCCVIVSKIIKHTNRVSKGVDSLYTDIVSDLLCTHSSLLLFIWQLLIMGLNWHEEESMNSSFSHWPYH